MTIKPATTWLWLLLLLPLGTAADWHRREAAIMGTVVTVELWHEDRERGRALAAAVMEEMHRIDRLMSSYTGPTANSRPSMPGPPMRRSRRVMNSAP